MVGSLLNLNPPVILNGGVEKHLFLFFVVLIEALSVEVNNVLEIERRGT